MIYLPGSILLLLLLLLLLPFLGLALAVDVVQTAAAKLGFSPGMGLLVLSAIIIGSTVNIPLYSVQSTVPVTDDFLGYFVRQYRGIPLHRVQQKTVVALNVGGGLIPVLLAVYQVFQASLGAILVTTAIVTVASYFAAQVVPGIGIQMNPLIAPLVAAVAATLIAGSTAAPVAFAGGVLGTLIGADLLHLRDIETRTAGVLSIGGAGVFDGIALCGLLALLLS
ncbi:MAG: DUF1614 domain-containing protein [Cyanobacteria bacterium P01_F01_bin.33]